MKLIVDVEKDYYEIIKYNVEHGEQHRLFKAIANGIPYEERPQGEWIETNSNDENIICPFCKTEFNGDIKLICGGENPKFCPDCGARMVGGEP